MHWIVPLLACSLLPAQMEKRALDRYRNEVFRKASPSVGSAAPDLCLFELSGQPKSLHLERGRFLVLIGGSYT